MKEIIFEVQEVAGCGYTTRALGHSIFTEAETLDELHKMVKDAVAYHFDVDSADRPGIIRLHL